ncbi:MAG: ArsR family transcriptional regulator [Ardenticatenales bacterium]|nr:ArsR family transcriptional regulator [Ardenticatenales bacterium]
MQSTRRDILQYLREHGTGSVEALAEAVGLAPVTVRHHLHLLRDDGLVDVAAEPAGRGRPRHVFRLSQTGGQAIVEDNRFAVLTARLLDAMRAADRGQIEGVFAAMAESIADTNRGSFTDRPVEDRLDAVVSLLAAEGFTTSWQPEGDGFVLHQLSCPFHALGEQHREVCCMDERLIEAVVGGAVEREEWRMDGSATCIYRIRTAV